MGCPQDARMTTGRRAAMGRYVGVVINPFSAKIANPREPRVWAAKKDGNIHPRF
jgi:hypothetical protein